jgi:hypothetical protein
MLGRESEVTTLAFLPDNASAPSNARLDPNRAASSSIALYPIVNMFTQ